MKIKTSPEHVLDFIFWPIIKMAWEPFSRKNSHFWHWKNYSLSVEYSIEIIGKDIKNRKNLWDELWQTNFAWQEAVIFETDYEGQFQAGFDAQENNRTRKQLCSLILNKKFAALVSSVDTRFFAISYPEKIPVMLRVVRITGKNNLDKDIILI